MPSVKKPKVPKPPNVNELAFFQILKEEGIPIPTKEYQFCPDRKWRADYCWIDECLILETEGGIWTNGRHTRGVGYKSDMEKYSEASVLGYRILRCETSELCSRKTIDWIKKCLDK